MHWPPPQAAGRDATPWPGLDPGLVW